MITVEDAACKVLRTYLVGQLAGVEILPDWPNPDKPIPAKAVSIIKIGSRRDFKVDPEIVGFDELTPPHAINKLFHWRVKACTQAIQLDVWACKKPDREDILARLDVALNQGTAVTLGLTFSGSQFRDGPLLALNPADGHTGFAAFTFNGAQRADTPDAIQRSEYRSSLTGDVAVDLVIKAQDAKIARIVLVHQMGATSSEYVSESYSEQSP